MEFVCEQNSGPAWKIRANPLNDNVQFSYVVLSCVSIFMVFVLCFTKRLRGIIRIIPSLLVIFVINLLLSFLSYI